MNERLKELRKTLGLTQQEFGARLDVSWRRVSAWERGEDGISTRISQICKEFKVRREWLERGEGEMFESTDSQSIEEIQRDFCRQAFEILPPEIQKVVLEALKEYAHAPKTPSPSREPSEAPAFNTVAQTSRQNGLES